MDKNTVIKLLNKNIPDHGYKSADITLITKIGPKEFQIDFGLFDFIFIKNNKIINQEF